MMGLSDLVVSGSLIKKRFILGATGWFVRSSARKGMMDLLRGESHSLSRLIARITGMRQWMRASGGICDRALAYADQHEGSYATGARRGAQAQRGPFPRVLQEEGKRRQRMLSLQ